MNTEQRRCFKKENTCRLCMSLSFCPIFHCLKNHRIPLAHIAVPLPLWTVFRSYYRFKSGGKDLQWLRKTETPAFVISFGECSKKFSLVFSTGWSCPEILTTIFSSGASSCIPLSQFLGVSCIYQVMGPACECAIKDVCSWAFSGR